MNSFEARPQAGAMNSIRGPRNFGRRDPSASIIIARNGKLTQLPVSPLAAAIGISLVAMFAVGYFAATAYLVLRDDLIGMTAARNARLMHEYEDRIATLRANLDRVTSRQLLDQQAIESRVAELMKRQEMLGGRSTRIGRLLEEADRRGLIPEGSGPETPAPLPLAAPVDPLRTGSLERPADPEAFASSLMAGAFRLRGAAGSAVPEAPAIGTPDLTDIAETQNLFSTVGERIEQVDERQRLVLENLRKRAAEKTSRIATVLASAGIRLDDDAVGGPFIPLPRASSFDDQVDALDETLKALDDVSQRLDRTPETSSSR